MKFVFEKNMVKLFGPNIIKQPVGFHYSSELRTTLYPFLGQISKVLSLFTLEFYVYYWFVVHVCTRSMLWSYQASSQSAYFDFQSNLNPSVLCTFNLQFSINSIHRAGMENLRSVILCNHHFPEVRPTMHLLLML